LAKTPIPSAIRFLLITLFINAVCFGIIVPVVPLLVQQLSGGDFRHATVIGGWLAFVFAGFQFFFSPVIGNLSDAFGRRPVLLVSLAGFAIEFWLMALAPSLFWLFVARIFSGISGASNASAQSSIADLASPEERARLFAMLGAAFGVGFVVGPAIGGALGELGPRIPFYAAATLVTANFVSGLLFCQETLAPENRRPFDWRRANPLGALLQARKMKGVLGLSLVYLLWQLASLVYPMIWNYFAMARWGWSPGIVGLSLACVGLGMAAVNILIAPKLIPKLGERWAALTGIGIGSVAMLAYAFTPYGWMAFVLILLMAFQSMSHPALTAMFSRRGRADTQGEMQGFASGVMALGSLLAPAIYFPLQNYFTGPNAPVQFDGAAMLAAGAIGLLAWLILALQRD
jgi:MFS transporter, DHA1 family, tetracycline resistance protein